MREDQRMRKTTRRGRTVRRALMLLVSVGVLAGATACGGDSDEDSSDTTPANTTGSVVADTVGADTPTTEGTTETTGESSSTDASTPDTSGATASTDTNSCEGTD